MATPRAPSTHTCDLLEIARSHDPTVVAAMIDMLEDLHASGSESRFVLLNAEVKTDATPSVAKIREALAILLAYRDREDVGLKGGPA